MESVLTRNKRLRRQNAVYEWLICSTKPECYQLPYEIARKIAEYVHAEEDNVSLVKVYHRIDRDPMKIYDNETDDWILFEPQEKPYYVIQTTAAKFRDVVTVNKGSITIHENEFLHTILWVDTCTISEDDFNRRIANGVPLFEGVSVNTRTGAITKGERPFAEFKPVTKETFL